MNIFNLNNLYERSIRDFVDTSNSGDREDGFSLTKIINFLKIKFHFPHVDLFLDFGSLDHVLIQLLSGKRVFVHNFISNILFDSINRLYSVGVIKELHFFVDSELFTISEKLGEDDCMVYSHMYGCMNKKILDLGDRSFTLIEDNIFGLGSSFGLDKGDKFNYFFGDYSILSFEPFGAMSWILVSRSKREFEHKSNYDVRVSFIYSILKFMDDVISKKFWIFNLYKSALLECVKDYVEFGVFPDSRIAVENYNYSHFVFRLLNLDSDKILSLKKEMMGTMPIISSYSVHESNIFALPIWYSQDRSITELMCERLEEIFRL